MNLEMILFFLKFNMSKASLLLLFIHLIRYIKNNIATRAWIYEKLIIFK